MAIWPPAQPQPNTATPVDQALVTPAQLPEVLLAVQHTQAVQTLHNECAGIRQEMGALQAEITALKSSKGDLEKDVSELKHLRSKIIGGAIVAGIVIASFFGVVWYFAGPTWTTMQTIASEYQVHKADRENDKTEDKTPGPSDIPTGNKQ